MGCKKVLTVPLNGQKKKRNGVPALFSVKATAVQILLISGKVQDRVTVEEMSDVEFHAKKGGVFAQLSNLVANPHTGACPSVFF